MRNRLLFDLLVEDEHVLSMNVDDFDFLLVARPYNNIGHNLAPQSISEKSLLGCEVLHFQTTTKSPKLLHPFKDFSTKIHQCGVIFVIQKVLLLLKDDLMMAEDLKIEAIDPIL